jgi:hypothetical protein
VKERTSVMQYCAKILDTSLKAIPKILSTESSNIPTEEIMLGRKKLKSESHDITRL